MSVDKNIIVNNIVTTYTSVELNIQKQCVCEFIRLKGPAAAVGDIYFFKELTLLGSALIHLLPREVFNLHRLLNSPLLIFGV